MFPYNNTPLKKKEEAEYALRCAKDITSMSTNNKIERQKEQYDKNVQYIEAIQNIKTYTQYLNKNLSIFGISNVDTRDDINFSPMGIVRLIYKSIYARIDKTGTEITIEGKDVETLKERESYLANIRNKKKMAPVIEQLTGLDPSYDVKDVKDEDIEMLETLGVPTLYEYLYEKLLKATNDYNEIQTDVFPYIINSLLCAGFAGTYLGYDNTGMVSEYPILPNEIKVVGGTKQDFSDADAFIITKKININELISYYINESITDEQRQTLESIKDKDGNIEVDILYWSALSYLPKKKIKNNKDEIVGVRGHGEKNKADYVITLHNWYNCYYIKQMDYVFNYGSIKNMPRVKGRNGNLLAYSPVNLINTSVVYESDTTPIISIMTKFEDMANLAFAKLQSEIANARASGYNINMAALNDGLEYLKDGNPTLQHADLIRVKLKTGISISSHRDSFDNPTVQQPFIYEEGGLSKAYSEFVAVINMAIEWCYMFSGTPRVDTGVEQDYRISNKAMQGMLSGADKSVSDILKAKDLYITKSSEKKVNMIMSIFNLPYYDNPYKSLLSEFEKEYLENIEIGTRQLFINFEKAFTDEEEQKLKEQANLALQSNMQSGGKEGISLQEFIIFEEFFKENKKMARVKLALLMRKREEQRLAESQQMQQENAQIQAQVQEQSSMNKLMEIKTEVDGEKEKKNLELRNKALEMVVKAELEKGTNSQEILALISSVIQPLEQQFPEPNEIQSDSPPELPNEEARNEAIL
ncbi:MAG TPA: hypothetical protein PK075_11485 [Chitinophagales bacterium]|nr:hypothetical protein [Chitinophagales bacterium]